VRSRLPTQYPNWFERAAAVALLRRIADNSPLSPAHTRLILGWMKLTNIRTPLKAQLPEGTPVAHKTGTSDVTNGLTHATNIGRITLLDGRKLAITVVATDSTADCTICDRVIARIAKALDVDAIHKHSHHAMLKAIKSN
jgi:beta-lactamase class A